MLRFNSALRAALCLCASAALHFSAAASLAAPILDPFSATVSVSATTNSPSGPGVTRNTSGSGPITDTAAEIFGSDTGTGSGTVDAFGLHAVATVHADNPDSYSVAALGSAGLVNPFMIVPRAGFSATHALVRIPYSFGGSFNSFPSLQGCPTCFGAVQASVGVDGMSQSFAFLGAHSQGTMNNPTFVAGGVAMGGVIEGMLPVNTVLYLRAGLFTNVHCQGANPSSCGMDGLFALSYAGSSPDDVDLEWALTPTLVPEPRSASLLATGILGLAYFARTQDRRASL